MEQEAMRFGQLLEIRRRRLSTKLNLNNKQSHVFVKLAHIPSNNEKKVASGKITTILKFKDILTPKDYWI
jgi:hypothetical protein